MRKKKRPEDSGETPEQRAERLALGLLVRREHSTRELTTKLTQRDLPDEIIHDTVASLQARNLLSEERFTEQFVRSRISRGDGPMKIRAELAQRGIDSARAEQELQAQAPDWNQLAEAQRRKRFGAEIPAEFSERARQARFLQGRGFGMNEIRKVLKGDITED